MRHWLYEISTKGQADLDRSSMVTHFSLPHTYPNIFFSETTPTDISRINMETLLTLRDFFANVNGHITKTAVLPIYGKTPLKLFFSTKRPVALGLGT